ncbi:hypothetical protein [Nostoc sp. MG11]|uniref:hypothetical protein n=1 Tax=Nostoc sp. MG11 TaxID=2721166 RepID=UPI001868974E|nr:hypothetical protein [Nostoc sp. MG11]
MQASARQQLIESLNRQLKTEPINIQLKSDGELNLRGVSLQNLSNEEWLILQQLIDESRVRSRDTKKLEEMMQRGMEAQGLIAACLVFMLLILGFFSLTRFVNYQIQQFQTMEVR